MKVKDYILTLKPVIWIKGSLMVLIGILNTRLGIGLGRVITNMYYGLPIFFLVCISGMLVVLAIKVASITSDEKTPGKKIISIICIVFTIIALAISIFHTVYFNLKIINILLLAILGIFWLTFLYIDKEWVRKSEIENIVISLSFSFGILYGAALNAFLIPIYIIVFFGAAFFLQFSKDLINDRKHIEKTNREVYRYIAFSLSPQNVHRLSLISNIMTIFFLILAFLLNFINSMLYIIPMIITIIIIGLAAVFTILINPERNYYRIVKVLLRIAMFFLFVTLIFASV